MLTRLLADTVIRVGEWSIRTGSYDMLSDHIRNQKCFCLQFTRYSWRWSKVKTLTAFLPPYSCPITAQSGCKCQLVGFRKLQKRPNPQAESCWGWSFPKLFNQSDKHLTEYTEPPPLDEKIDTTTLQSHYLRIVIWLYRNKILMKNASSSLEVMISNSQEDVSFIG